MSINSPLPLNVPSKLLVCRVVQQVCVVWKILQLYRRTGKSDVPNICEIEDQIMWTRSMVHGERNKWRPGSSVYCIMSLLTLCMTVHCNILLYSVALTISLNTAACRGCPSRCRLCVWYRSHPQGSDKRDICIHVSVVSLTHHLFLLMYWFCYVFQTFSKTNQYYSGICTTNIVPTAAVCIHGSVDVHKVGHVLPTADRGLQHSVVLSGDP